jgi:hypothetical protein
MQVQVIEGRCKFLIVAFFGFRRISRFFLVLEIFFFQYRGFVDD